MRLLTQGAERANQAKGISTCVPLHHPVNRAALRRLYKDTLPRSLRKAIFGRHIMRRLQFPAWDAAT